MKSVSYALQVTILLFASIDYGWTRTETGVKWTDIKYTSEIFLRQPEPAAIYPQEKWWGYLCRGFVGSKDGIEQYLPGTLWIIDNYKLVCRLPTESNTRLVFEFQMLEGRPGTTSWVRYKGEIPSCAVPGGHNENNEPVYVCRGLYQLDGYFGTGWITSSPNDKCRVTTVMPSVEVDAEIEILCVNLYGTIR